MSDGTLNQCYEKRQDLMLGVGNSVQCIEVRLLSSIGDSFKWTMQ